jgi:replicative DNA helicase
MVRNFKFLYLTVIEISPYRQPFRCDVMANTSRLPPLFDDDISPPAAANDGPPPSNTHAEQALLGTLLANNKAYDRVGDFLAPEHFADPVHGAIYAAIQRRCVLGQTADAVTLRSEFELNGKLAEVGGPPYLAQLLGAMVGVSNARDYASVIYEMWVRRSVIDAAAEMAIKAQTTDTAPRELVLKGIKDLERTLLPTSSKPMSLLDAVDKAVTAGERTAAGNSLSINTGFKSMDRRLGGLEGGAVYILAARPGMGKTALGLEIGINVAETGVGVCLVSLEMQAPQLGRRALAWLAGLPQKVIRQGAWNEAQAQRILEARTRLLNLPMTIDDQSGVNIQQIALKARTAMRKHGLGLLIVDHLHIVGQDVATTRMGPTWGVGQVSNGLKRLAKDMGIPILALAQLKRIEAREDKRPTMEDLRQSGEIEQDAEAVMFIYREEYYLGNVPPPATPNRPAEYNANKASQWQELRKQAAGKAEIIFAKVRDDEPGTEYLAFNGPTTSFHEITHQDNPQEGFWQ